MLNSFGQDLRLVVVDDTHDTHDSTGERYSCLAHSGCSWSCLWLISESSGKSETVKTKTSVLLNIKDMKHGVMLTHVGVSWRQTNSGKRATSHFWSRLSFSVRQTVAGKLGISNCGIMFWLSFWLFIEIRFSLQSEFSEQDLHQKKESPVLLKENSLFLPKENRGLSHI